MAKADPGVVELTTALRINPNHADAWAFLGVVKALEGCAVEGIEDLQKAFRLNPHPPGWYYWHLGLVQYTAGQYEAAVETLGHEATHRLGSQRILTASLAQLDRMEEARVEQRSSLACTPTSPRNTAPVDKCSGERPTCSVLSMDISRRACQSEVMGSICFSSQPTLVCFNSVCRWAWNHQMSAVGKLGPLAMSAFPPLSGA
jgi:tetratricopeptide (TPR) repeat protein